MATMLAFFEGPFWTHLVAALLHTLWIGALAALVLAFLLRRIPASRSGQRYGLAAGALATVVAGGLIVLALLEAAPARTGEVAEQGAMTESHGNSASPGKKPTTTRTPRAAEARQADESISNQGLNKGSVSAKTDAADRALPSPAPARPTVPAQPHPTPRQAAAPWSAWLAGVWLIGAALMLARMCVRIVGAGRFRRACRPLEDIRILSLVEELARTMRLARRVAVLVSESEIVPCVVGAVWPAILLPASLLTGVPAEHLRALLAHELAHIRRHDYLVNLAQMLVESLLFFNPFVWWISRQIRIEREACCDALAAAATGEGQAYARALVDYAELRLNPALAQAPAFGEPARSSGLLDRIRRLAQPGYRPALRLPWPTLVMFLIISALGLACMKKASDGAVVLAIKALTPQQRIEKIAEIQKSYDPASSEENRDYSAQDNITVKGRVVTADGGPLPKEGLYLRTFSQRPHVSSYGMMDAKPDGSFEGKIAYGSFSMAIKVPGYAFAWVGPLQAPPGGKIENVRIVLRQGFIGEIKVVDPQGRPIPSAKLEGGYNIDGAHDENIWEGSSALRSDKNGIAEVDDALTQTLQLKGVAQGFEETEWKAVQLAPGKATVLTMQPAKPTGGVIVEAGSGKPVAEARIYRVAHYNAGSVNFVGRGTVVANSGPDGRFSLDNLNQDKSYAFYVAAKGYRREALTGIHAGNDQLRVEMRPPLTVRGRVLGVGRARKINGKPVIEYSQGFTVENCTDGGDLRSVELKVNGDEGTFEFSDLWDGDVILKAGAITKQLTVHKPLDNVVLDLRPQTMAKMTSTSATREVIIKLELPSGVPATSGTLRVYYVEQEEPPNVPEHIVQIKDNVARLRVPAPNRSLSYQILKLAGYWIPEKWGIEIPAGKDPFEIKIPATPAGAIYGEVFEADGKPARGIMVSVVEIKEAPERKDSALNVRGKDGTSDSDTFNKFMLSPLPLGGTYAAVVWRRQTYVMSAPITIDGKQPLVQTKMTIPVGVTVSGRVLDEAGRPLRGIKVALNYQAPPSNGFGDQGIQSDTEGRFAFDHVNPDTPGKYMINASGKDYQSQSVEIKPDVKPVEIRMRQGYAITGQAVDAETGKPVPDAEINAWPQQIPGESEREYLKHINWTNADGKTDVEGRFKFSQLDNRRKYRLGCSAGQVEPEVTAQGGQAAPVTLRIKLYAWEKKKREGNGE